MLVKELAIFHLEEATIDELQAAIRAGQITCVEVVAHYLARARAFNGVPSVLVTKDGESVPQAKGTVRAGAPIAFPRETATASSEVRLQPAAAGIHAALSRAGAASTPPI